VRDGHGLHGGVEDTLVPNYVYRWTEREVLKTILSFAPHAEPQIDFRYGHALPATSGSTRRSRRLLIRWLTPSYKLFALAFPRQQNLFLFTISVPRGRDRLRPWLKDVDGRLAYVMSPQGCTAPRDPRTDGQP
jgi:hypothetical protein